MTKPKIILYAEQRPYCSYCSKIFNHEFELISTETQNAFLKKIKHTNADAAVLCYCSANENDVPALTRLNFLSGPIPVLICSKRHNPNFIRLAAQSGVDNFLYCDMEKDKIRHCIVTVIHSNSLKSFLELSFKGKLNSSTYIKKMIREIIHIYPRRITTREISRRLGISPRRIQMLCQQAFGRTFTQIIRRILVFYALNLMKYTNLDNFEIALKLDYSEVNSLNRIFRKELGQNPGEARKRLAVQNPEKMFS